MMERSPPHPQPSPSRNCPPLSSRRLDVHSCVARSVSTSSLFIVHGAFMGVAWLGLLPAGAYAARFTRARSPVSGPDAFWFKWHKRLQYSGVAFALIGFIIAIFMQEHTGLHFTSLHSRIGLAVMVAAALQPANAWCRPAPSAQRRWMWSLLHMGLGYVTLLFALLTVFLGLHMVVSLTASTVVAALFAAAVVAWAIRAFRTPRGLPSQTAPAKFKDDVFPQV